MAGRAAADALARRLPAKLHAVTLVRSGIGHAADKVATLRKLKLTKVNRTVVWENTPSVNGWLYKVRELIRVRPVVVEPELLQARDVEHVYAGTSPTFFGPDARLVRLHHDGRTRYSVRYTHPFNEAHPMPKGKVETLRKALTAPAEAAPAEAPTTPPRPAA